MYMYIEVSELPIVILVRMRMPDTGQNMSFSDPIQCNMADFE